MKISIGEPQVNSAGKYKVDKWVYDAIKRIMGLQAWHQRKALEDFFNEIMPIQQRTSSQNSALWLFLTQLADTLNAGGLLMKKVLKPEVDIEWNKNLCHDYLWIPLQKAICGTDSTTELEKQMDIDRVHETLMRHLGEKFHVEFIPFPSEPEKKEEKEIEYPDYEKETGLKEGEPHPLD